MVVMLKQKQTGFTIVELLIVIVVIGILAAITIVAYNGIQNRANDTAVQSDLRQLASKVMEQHALTGDYPIATSPANIPGIPTFTFSKSSYDISVYNVYYCTGIISGQREFTVAAASKSGKKFMYRSHGGAGEYTGTWSNSAVICPGVGFTGGYTHTFGYDYTTTTWNAWAR